MSTPPLITMVAGNTQDLFVLLVRTAHKQQQPHQKQTHHRRTKMDINEPWKCPQCLANMDAEEQAEVKEIVEKRGQAEIKCIECGEDLMADIDAFDEGEFQLVEMWNYN